MGIGGCRSLSLPVSRFPVGIGIAGYVAETGETMNVRNAYSDPRFNKAIDEQTGYNTESILCMPICIRGQVRAARTLLKTLLPNQCWHR